MPQLCMRLSTSLTTCEASTRVPVTGHTPPLARHAPSSDRVEQVTSMLHVCNTWCKPLTDNR